MPLQASIDNRTWTGIPPIENRVATRKKSDFSRTQNNATPFSLVHGAIVHCVLGHANSFVPRFRGPLLREKTRRLSTTGITYLWWKGKNIPGGPWRPRTAPLRAVSWLKLFWLAKSLSNSPEPLIDSWGLALAPLFLVYVLHYEYGVRTTPSRIAGTAHLGWGTHQGCLSSFVINSLQVVPQCSPIPSCIIHRPSCVVPHNISRIPIQDAIPERKASLGRDIAADSLANHVIDDHKSRLSLVEDIQPALKRVCVS
jgi:hypothetical protein